MNRELIFDISETLQPQHGFYRYGIYFRVSEICRAPVIRISCLVTQKYFIASVMLILCVIRTLCAKLTLICVAVPVCRHVSGREPSDGFCVNLVWTVWYPKLVLLSFLQHDERMNLYWGSYSAEKFCMVTVFEKKKLLLKGYLCKMYDNKMAVAWIISRFESHS
jgi:hypothetical protein